MKDPHPHPASSYDGSICIYVVGYCCRLSHSDRHRRPRPLLARTISRRFCIIQHDASAPDASEWYFPVILLVPILDCWFLFALFLVIAIIVIIVLCFCSATTTRKLHDRLTGPARSAPLRIPSSKHSYVPKRSSTPPSNFGRRLDALHSRLADGQWHATGCRSRDFPAHDDSHYH